MDKGFALDSRQFVCSPDFKLTAISPLSSLSMAHPKLNNLDSLAHVFLRLHCSARGWKCLWRGHSRRLLLVASLDFDIFENRRPFRVKFQPTQFLARQL